jgi:hypothetical protein
VRRRLRRWLRRLRPTADVASPSGVSEDTQELDMEALFADADWPWPKPPKSSR